MTTQFTTATKATTPPTTKSQLQPKPQQQSHKWSWFLQVLLCLASGVLMGSYCVYQYCSFRVNVLWNELETNHNATLQEFQQRLMISSSSNSHTQCLMRNDTNTKELQKEEKEEVEDALVATISDGVNATLQEEKLKGQLEDLLEKYHKGIQDVSRLEQILQQERDEHARQLQAATAAAAAAEAASKQQQQDEYKNTLRVLEQQQQLQQQQLEDANQALSSKLSQLETMYEESNMQRLRLQNENDKQTNEWEIWKQSMSIHQTQLEEQHQKLQEHVQRRQKYLCREFYGKGPYYVRFDVRFGGDEDEDDDYYYGEDDDDDNVGPAATTKTKTTSAAVTQGSFFVVEIAGRTHVPHSIFTFLFLVEAHLYDGTAFSSGEQDTEDGEGTFRLGRQPEFTTPSWVDKKIEAFGFGSFFSSSSTALGFLEESSSSLSSCESSSYYYSIGFQGLGPALEVFPPGFQQNEDGPTPSCFGRVVRGGDVLHQITNRVRTGEAVDVLEVRQLVFDDDGYQ